jgi:hypothetical protein
MSKVRSMTLVLILSELLRSVASASMGSLFLGDGADMIGVRLMGLILG